MEEQQVLALLAGGDPDGIREGAYEAGNAKMASALPLLIEKLATPNPGVQESVDYALRKIGGQQVILAMMPLLRSENVSVRNLSMDVLREIGKSDVHLLGELLNDDDPDVRIFGADILGSTGSALAVSQLSRALLYDPEVNVRYQAAVSLGALAYPEAAPALNQALNDDEWVRFAVIEALTKVKAESSVGAMLKILDNSSDLVAANIVEAIGNLGHIKAVPVLIKRLPQSSPSTGNRIVRAIVQLLGVNSLNLLGKEEHATLCLHMLTALSDDDADVQDAAIDGLCSSKYFQAFPAIFKLLSGLDADRDHERMLHIVQALAGMGYNPMLEERLLEGEDAEKLLVMDILSYIHDRAATELLKSHYWEQGRDVRRSCLNVLSAVCGREDVDFFVQVLDKEKDGTALKSALLFLGRMGDGTLVYEKVWPFLTHGYPDVQDAALDALMTVRDPEIRARFVEMTQAEEVFNRQMAYYALRSYNDEADIVPQIALGLHDESPEVRRMAVESLGNGGRDLTVERMSYLAPCLNDEDKDVRLAVIDVLGMCPDNMDEKYLLRGLDDPDPWIRARCVESLGKKHDALMGDKLLRMLQDKHILVVLKTIEALVECGNRAVLKHLLPLMEHPEEDVQRAAVEAVEKIRQASGAGGR
ncbi:MAG: HEAT repeat domain-containing protein [Deltaproteobacteria bacterium]|nr:HEAT repeat domain-containing protein [Deltaproteobacteria bacterium]